jgi:hypothetical protein
MASLPLDTWLWLIIWLVIGMAVYFGLWQAPQSCGREVNALAGSQR